MPMAETTQDAAQSVTISDACARRLRELLSADDNAGKSLRVAVGGGGCSGFQYSFDMDATRNDDDHVIEKDGVCVLIDDVSWGFLAGSEVHYDEELVGAWFTVRNPNASSTCGCGASFAFG